MELQAAEVLKTYRDVTVVRKITASQDRKGFNAPRIWMIVTLSDRNINKWPDLYYT